MHPIYPAQVRLASPLPNSRPGARCGENTTPMTRMGRTALLTHLGSLGLALLTVLAASMSAFAEPPPPAKDSPAASRDRFSGEAPSIWSETASGAWEGDSWDRDLWENSWGRDELRLSSRGSDLFLPPSLLQTRADLLGQVTLARRLPGTQVVRYRGFQGFVVKRLRRVYQSRWRRSLRDEERAGGLDHFQLAARYQAMAEAESDLAGGGRWWERSWLHSLPAHKGGAPEGRHETVIGSQVEVFRLGPLSVTNDFRARIRGIGFRVAPDAGRVFRDLAEGDLARDHATLSREFGAREFGEDEEFGREDLNALPDRPRSPTAEQDEERKGYAPDEKLAATDLLDLSLEAAVPQPDLAWKIHFRPEARVRLRAGATPRARAGLRAVLELYMGPAAARKHVVDVIARVRYDLVRRDLVATIQLQLVAW